MSNSLVSIQIIPKTKNGDDVIPYVDAAIGVIDAAGVKYEVHPLETTMEGELPELLSVIEKMNIKMEEMGCESIISQIKVLYSPDSISMDELTEKYQGWRPVVVILSILILWEISVRFFQIPVWLLPAPSQIWQAGVEGWQDFHHHLTATIKLAVIGYVLGSVFGIETACCLHLLPTVREAFYPLIILSQNIPIIVLAPLLVIWFGFGVLPKIIIITLVCFFPITVAALDGFRQTDSNLMHYMKMAGANRRQIFEKLEWPYALPSVFSGLKIAATYSVMGAVIAEWLGAGEGIGVYMTLASSSFQTAQVFVAIFYIMALSLVFFAAINGLERVMIKWRPERS